MLKDLEQRGAGAIDIKTNSTTLLNVPPKKSHKLMTYLLFSMLAIITVSAYFNFWDDKKQLPMHEADAKNTMPAVTINDVPTTPAPEVTLETSAIVIPPVNTMPEPLTVAEPSNKPVKANNTESAKFIQDSTSVDKIKATPKADSVVGVKPPAQFETNLNYSSPAMNSNPPVAKEDTMATDIESANVTSEKKSAKNDSSARKSNQTASIRKEIKPEQKSIAYHQQALAKLQQGRVSEAQDDLAQALEVDPSNHEARLTLASLLLDNKHHKEARDLLAKGLANSPEQTDFRIALARLQVDAGDPAALSTLEEGQAYAKNNAEYQSFLATLLQRTNRHDDAIIHYKNALSLTENTSSRTTASMLIGLGISLQASNKLEDAKLVFDRAKKTNTLPTEFREFIDQQLKQIHQRLQH